MTTKLEKEFFDIFGIKPYDKYYNCKLNLEGGCKPEKSCCTCKCSEEVYYYPPITDRILLELICVCSKYGFYPTARNIKDLKLKVLKRLLELKKNLKNNYEHQGCHNAFTRKVQKIFEV